MEAVDTPEDIEFLKKMIKLLLVQADESMSAFYCHKENDYSKFDRVNSKTGKIVSTEPKYAQFHTLEVSWRPASVDHQTYKHIQLVRLRFVPSTGDFNLSFEYEDNNAGSGHGRRSPSKEHYADYNLGFNSLQYHKEMKLDFFKLYKKILTWQEVTEPKKQRDDMVQAVCEMFPTIMDDVLFGDDSDQTTS